MQDMIAIRRFNSPKRRRQRSNVSILAVSIHIWTLIISSHTTIFARAISCSNFGFAQFSSKMILTNNARSRITAIASSSKFHRRYVTTSAIAGHEMRTKYARFAPSVAPIPSSHHSIVRAWGWSNLPTKNRHHLHVAPLSSSSSSNSPNHNFTTTTTTTTDDKNPQSSLQTNNAVPSTASIQNQLLVDPTSEERGSIYQTLLASIAILERYSAPEPIESACHLLSSALEDDFDWEDNGFAVLRQMMDQTPQSITTTAGTTTTNLRSKIITHQELLRLSQSIHRRIQNEPLQYILGRWDFHLITLNIRRPCLCPRPETEELVEYVAGDIRRIVSRLREGGDGRKVRVLDVGSGTGAIGIALASVFGAKDVTVVSIDVMREAVDLSRENAALVLGGGVGNGRYESVLCSADAYSNMRQVTGSGETYVFDFDVVVSNPPYIPRGDMATLDEDVRLFEDHGALCGGDDGMDVIRDIVARLPEWCRISQDDDNDACNESHSCKPVCWMEVDPSQPQLIKRWLSNQDILPQDLDNTKVKFVDDYADFGGLDRFVKLQIE